MSDINQSKIRQLDGNLLLIFQGLMRSRKASTVAVNMNVTQSTVSHALRRLRETFDDPLFIRQPHGFEPTAYALAIEPFVQTAVEALHQALSNDAGFDPATSDVRLRLSALDHTISTLFPDLITRCLLQAPSLRISVKSCGRSEALWSLKDGEVDLAIGYFWDLPNWVDQFVLGAETYRVVARQHHPKLGGGLTLETFCKCDHVVVSVDGNLWGVADKALRDIGLRRNLVSAVPHFLSALAIVSRTDCLSILPASMVDQYAEGFGLEIFPVPFELRGFSISALWHHRDARRAERIWLLENLRMVAEQNLGSGQLGA